LGGGRDQRLGAPARDLFTIIRCTGKYGALSTAVEVASAENVPGEEPNIVRGQVFLTREQQGLDGNSWRILRLSPAALCTLLRWHSIMGFVGLLASA
jgi:hypothetical protein